MASLCGLQVAKDELWRVTAGAATLCSASLGDDPKLAPSLVPDFETE